MLDEPAFVTCGASRPPERIFEGSQRTNRSGQLRVRAPRGGWQMQRGPGPAMEHEYAADEHEHNEREVDNEHRVGSKAR